MWIFAGLYYLQNIAANIGFCMYLYMSVQIYIYFIYIYMKRKTIVNVMENYEQITSMEVSVIKHIFLRANLIDELLRKIFTNILHFGKYLI